MKSDSDQQFFRFLSLTSPQKEVSLAMARDEAELEEFQEILNQQGFRQSKNAFELQEGAKTPSKSYLLLDYLSKKDLKDAYDFCVQYPTGSVELFNRKQMQSVVVSPNYQNTTVIFLAKKEIIFKMQKQGLNILAAVGLTYQ
jgi:hypothetical protein